jgi:hypothetical protein
MALMSVQETSVPELADPALELVISQVETDVQNLMDALTDVESLPRQLLDEVGAGGSLAEDSSVRQDARFLRDSAHLSASCGKLAHALLDNLVLERGFLSRVVDMHAPSAVRMRQKLFAQATDRREQLTSFSQQISQRLMPMELVTEEGRLTREHLQGLAPTIERVADALGRYEHSLKHPQPQLDKLDIPPADLGSFSDRAQSHGQSL